MPSKFFHVSPRWFSVGTILLPPVETGLPVDQVGHSSREEWVFLSTHRVHWTCLGVALAQNWFIYQVKPRDTIFTGEYSGEYVTKKAEVIRYLGRTRKYYKRRGIHHEDAYRHYYRRLSMKS